MAHTTKRYKEKVFSDLPAGTISSQIVREDTNYIIQQIRNGFPSKTVSTLQKTCQLKPEQFAKIIGISNRTLTRLNKEQRRMDPVVSDRLYRLGKIIELAAHVFEDKDMAIQWLKKPQPCLNNHIPLDLLDTEPGAHAVENLLGQIEYGVLS